MILVSSSLAFKYHSIPMPQEQVQSLLKDALDAFILVIVSFSLQDHIANLPVQFARLSWPRLLKSWVSVPFGIVLMLLVCFGINTAISTSHISFPASVACMVLLFFVLLGSNAAVGEKRTRQIVHMIEVPVGS